MLNIYAQTFLTATRAPCVRLRDMPSQTPSKRRRWFSLRQTRCVDPAKL
jgi:hypothetical protein